MFRVFSSAERRGGGCGSDWNSWSLTRRVYLIIRFVADLIVISVLTGLSVFYLTHLALSVPAEHALMVNFMLIPAILGITAFFLFARSVLRAFPWMVVVSVAHILFLSEVPAKLGVQYSLAAVEFLFICSGMVLAAAVWRLMRLSVGKFD